MIKIKVLFTILFISFSSLAKTEFLIECPAPRWEILKVSSFLSSFSRDSRVTKGTCTILLPQYTWWETMPTSVNILQIKKNIVCRYQDLIKTEDGTKYIEAYVDFHMSVDKCRSNPGCMYSCDPDAVAHI